MTLVTGIWGGEQPDSCLYENEEVIASQDQQPIISGIASLTQATELAEGLFPHQVDGLAFLLARRRSILADDMGLGKTRQSVLAMQHAAPAGPWLVVCPASVKTNWKREIHLALKNDAVPVAIVDRKNPPPTAGWQSWIVINYDILKTHLPALKHHAFAGIVFDEAHYLKNYTSQRSKAAQALMEANEKADPIVHCLTGTPLTNRPRDLFPLLQIVKHSLGRSFLSFAKRYCDAIKGEYGWITDGSSNIEELTVQLHGIMLRRRKDDVLDLPGKLRSWFTLEIPDSTGRREARSFLEAILTAHEEKHEKASVESSVALMGRLAPARKKIAIAKVKNTIEFVDGILEQGEKVIIYSCYTPPTTMFTEHYGDAARMLTGKTPTHLRQGIVDEFQTDDTVRVLVANIIAGGVGINLTAARHVVFNDLDWVPANHWQAEDRAYRIGQTGTVNVYYFAAAGTLDEFVSEVLRAKSEIVAAVVEGESVAIEGAETSDVLEELRRLVSSTGATDIDQLVNVHRSQHPGPSQVRATKKPAVSSAAIDALARALDRPDTVRYQLPNSKGDGHYLLEVDTGDVICDCRGFNFRGQCKHSRILKDAIAQNQAIPEGYEAVK